MKKVKETKDNNEFYVIFKSTHLRHAKSGSWKLRLSGKVMASLKIAVVGDT
jgi:hypothetical protein